MKLTESVNLSLADTLKPMKMLGVQVLSRDVDDPKLSRCLAFDREILIQGCFASIGLFEPGPALFRSIGGLGNVYVLFVETR